LRVWQARFGAVGQISGKAVDQRRTDLITGAQRHAHGAKDVLQALAVLQENVVAGGQYQRAIASSPPRQHHMRHRPRRTVAAHKRGMGGLQRGINDAGA
jgi:hypothetical protein